MGSSVLHEQLVSLLQKVEPVSLEGIPNGGVMLFGSGGFAKSIYAEHASGVTHVIEHCDSVSSIDKRVFRVPVIAPEHAQGNVVLGTGNGSYQFNQLRALASRESHIDKVFLVDPYIEKRSIGEAPPQDTVLLLEHADGVVRHQHHLAGLKEHFRSRGKVVTSLCPLTLYYYQDYWSCADIIVWNGQRELYRIVDHLFPQRSVTYVEYGFFPQKDYYYLDKKGVSQHSSLMTDDLDWVTNKHYEYLEEVRSRFLGNFTHRGNEYVLVPLQVPDDANVLQCSRFTQGMQEFIDFIDGYYPRDKRVVFKPHPKDPFSDAYDYRGRETSDEPFTSLLERASHVHGITSSTLYEAALAGVEIVAEGHSLLATHAGNVKALLAAMVDRQIPVEKENIEYWLKRFSFIH